MTYSRFGKVLAVAAFAAALCLGCNDPNRMETTLRALERGKAEGQLVLTSDGRVSIDQQISFGFGASRSSLSFSGKINFNDKLNRPVPGAPEGKEAP